MCPGYQDEAALFFRRYCGEGDDRSPPERTREPFESRIQCLTPSPESLQQCAFDDSEFEQRALAAFIDDYCIVSTNESLSRGYLHGLESLLTDAGPSSDIAKAARIAAFASLGNKTGDPDIGHRASELYLDLLHSFQITMSMAATSNTVESLTTAVLLGLYEIISATKSHPGEHGAHVRGVSAILSDSNFLVSRHPAKRFFNEADSPLLRDPSGGSLMWPQDLGILCPPNGTPSVQSLDALLLRFAPIFRQGQILTSNMAASSSEIRQFREYAMCVDEEFALWPACQSKEWRPKTIGLVERRENRRLLLDTTSPTRVDTYFDLYVSAVWNSYRKCRLFLLDFIYTCSERLHDDNEISTKSPSATTASLSRRHILREARDLAEDVAASIPFHLAQNPEVFLWHTNPTRKQEVIRANRSVGGLLLIHPLHVVTELSVVPKHLKEMFRGHLAWIGRVMGIGQAGVLADPSSSLPGEFVLNGHILVWAGTIVSQKQMGNGDALD